MQAGIRNYADHPLIGEARGIGLIGAVEVVRNKATKESFDPEAGVAAYLVRRAQHHGAILRNMPGDIVAFSPPLIISEAEIDEMLACFGRALDDTWAMVREKRLVGGVSAAGPSQGANCAPSGGVGLHASDPIVRFDRIGKTYDGMTRVVDDLQLDIERGEFLTLLGPSGSGKTTTLMMLAGFETPTAGEILLDGKPLAHLPPFKRQIGMVFQNYALFPHMSVAENIAFPLSVRGVSRDEMERRVERALDMVQLGGFGGRPAGTALGRAATAGGRRPRTGLRAETGADGRATGGSRQAASRTMHSRSGACISGSASPWST